MKFSKFNSFPEIAGKLDPRSPRVDFSCKNMPFVFPRHLQVFRRCRQMPENSFYIFGILSGISLAVTADITPLNNIHTQQPLSLTFLFPSFHDRRESNLALSTIFLTDASIISRCRPYPRPFHSHRSHHFTTGTFIKVELGGRRLRRRPPNSCSLTN